jgi:hypothetical protein
MEDGYHKDPNHIKPKHLVWACKILPDNSYQGDLLSTETTERRQQLHGMVCNAVLRIFARRLGMGQQGMESEEVTTTITVRSQISERDLRQSNNQYALISPKYAKKKVHLHHLLTQIQ